MENVDTVLLNVSDYNELRDFKKEIEAGFTYRLDYSMWGGAKIKFIGTDKALEEMGTQLQEAYKEIDELKRLDKKQTTIKEIKKIKEMTWWQFRKWRRS